MTVTNESTEAMLAASELATTSTTNAHPIIRRTRFHSSFVCLSFYNERNTDISIRYGQGDERQRRIWRDDPIRLGSVGVVHTQSLLGGVEDSSANRTER